MAKTIIGVDFGHGVVRAAEVSPSGRRPVLHRYGEIVVPRDAIREGVVVDPDVVTAALKQLWSEAGFRSRSVVLGVGSQQVLTREVLIPHVPLAHVRETLPFRVQDMLPLPVEDTVLDFFPIAEVDGEDGPQWRGLLVAATKESVLANARAVEAAGLRTVDVDLIPFAVSRLHLGEHAGSGVEVLLHIGAVSTCIVVAEHGVPQFVRVIPSGGHDVTTALMERLSIDEDTADELKRRVGMLDEGLGAQPAQAARIAAEASFELVRAVRSTLSFYRNAHEDAEVGGLVLSGGGAELRGFAEALGAAVDIPVTAGRAGARFTVAAGVDQAALATAGPAPTVALALTMRSGS